MTWFSFDFFSTTPPVPDSSIGMTYSDPDRVCELPEQPLLFDITTALDEISDAKERARGVRIEQRNTQSQKDTIGVSSGLSAIGWASLGVRLSNPWGVGVSVVGWLLGMTGLVYGGQPASEESQSELRTQKKRVHDARDELKVLTPELQVTPEVNYD